MPDKQFMLICARSRQGFFTNFIHILQYLKDSEVENRIPIIHWEGGIYVARKNRYNGVKSKNIWDYFFEPVSSYNISDLTSKYDLSQWGNIRGRIKNTKIVWEYRHISMPYEPPYGWSTKLYPPDSCLNFPTQEFRNYANEIIKKHIKIKQVVMDKLELFYKDIKDRNILGVHIRGTKELERDQGHNFFDRYIKHINNYVDQNNECIIFIATDHVRYLEELIKMFGKRIVFRNTTRSNNEHAVQYGCKPKRKFNPGGAQVAEEVIIDCLVLSRSNHMIRGFSNVPSVASFFNPDLPMTCACQYNEDDKKFLGIGSPEYQNYLETPHVDSKN